MTKEKKKSKWDTTGEGWEDDVVTDSYLRVRGLKIIQIELTTKGARNSPLQKRRL